MTLNYPYSTDPPLRLLVKFGQLYPDQPPHAIFQAPGFDLWIAAVFPKQERFTLHALEVNENAAITFTLQSARQMRTITQRPLARWARYPAGVIALLDWFNISGMYAVICGDETVGVRYEYGAGILIAALWHELREQPYTLGDLSAIVDNVQREAME
jgi:hypothetical protein